MTIPTRLHVGDDGYPIIPYSGYDIVHPLLSDALGIDSLTPYTVYAGTASRPKGGNWRFVTASKIQNVHHLLFVVNEKAFNHCTHEAVSDLKERHCVIAQGTDALTSTRWFLVENYYGRHDAALAVVDFDYKAFIALSEAAISNQARYSEMYRKESRRRLWKDGTFIIRERRASF